MIFSPAILFIGIIYLFLSRLIWVYTSLLYVFGSKHIETVEQEIQEYKEQGELAQSPNLQILSNGFGILLLSFCLLVYFVIIQSFDLLWVKGLVILFMVHRTLYTFTLLFQQENFHKGKKEQRWMKILQKGYRTFLLYLLYFEWLFLFILLLGHYGLKWF